MYRLIAVLSVAEYLTRLSLSHYYRPVTMSILLGLLVLTGSATPMIPGSVDHIRLPVDLEFSAILGIGVFAVVNNRRLLVALALCTAVALVTRWLGWLVVGGISIPVRDYSLCLSLITLSVSVGFNVFRQDEVVGERVVGAVVLYLLIGIVWAVGYQILEPSSRYLTTFRPVFSPSPTGSTSVTRR